MRVTVRPGFCFGLPCDFGYAVAIVTHQITPQRDLVWVAEDVFEAEPSSSQLQEIAAWRWPTCFLTAAAVRKRLVVALGEIPIPPRLAPFPLMRNGARGLGWTAVSWEGGQWRSLGAAEDPNLPINDIVNVEGLRERVVSGWKPAQIWN